MLTLWDLLPAKKRPKPPQGRRSKSRAGPDRPTPGTTPGARAKPAHSNGTAGNGHAARLSMAERYEHMTREMLRTYGVRVRKWRTSMSGVAWQVTYRDGSVSRLIEAPRPKGPMSAAVFLHEIGHHALGFHVYRPRCLEEYHAWAFAIHEMERLGLNVTDGVRRRMHESLHYAIIKARRSGLKRIPEELAPFAEPPPSRPRRRSRRSRPSPAAARPRPRARAG